MSRAPDPCFYGEDRAELLTGPADVERFPPRSPLLRERMAQAEARLRVEGGAPYLYGAERRPQYARDATDTPESYPAMIASDLELVVSTLRDYFLTPARPGYLAPRHGRTKPRFLEGLRASGKSLEHHLASVTAQIRSCGGLAVGGSWDAVLRLASDPECLRQHLRQCVPRLDALSWGA